MIEQYLIMFYYNFCINIQGTFAYKNDNFLKIVKHILTIEANKTYLSLNESLKLL